MLTVYNGPVYASAALFFIWFTAKKVKFSGLLEKTDKLPFVCSDYFMFLLPIFISMISSSLSSLSSSSSSSSSSWRYTFDKKIIISLIDTIL